MSRSESRVAEPQDPSTSMSTRTEPTVWQPGPFDYQRLDAYRVALQALVDGDRLARHDTSRVGQDL